MFRWLVSVKIWGWRWNSTFWCDFVPGFVSICSIRTTEWAREISPSNQKPIRFWVFSVCFLSINDPQTNSRHKLLQRSRSCSCRSAQWGADLQLFLIAKKRLKPLRAPRRCRMLRSWSLRGGRFGFLDLLGTLQPPGSYFWVAKMWAVVFEIGKCCWGGVPNLAGENCLKKKNEKESVKKLSPNFRSNCPRVPLPQ